MLSETHIFNIVHHVSHLVFLVLLTCLSTVLFLVALMASQRSDTVIHKSECLVDITLLYLGTEIQLGHGLRKSDDSEECPRGHIQIAGVS